MMGSYSREINVQNAQVSNMAQKVYSKWVIHYRDI